MVQFLSEVSDFEQHKKNSYQFIESCSKCDSSLLYQTAELFSDNSLYNFNPKMAQIHELTENLAIHFTL